MEEGAGRRERDLALGVRGPHAKQTNDPDRSKLEPSKTAEELSGMLQ